MAMEPPQCWSTVGFATYIVEASFLSKNPNDTRYGGGLCIHPDGLILTVAQIIPSGTGVSVRVRAKDSDEFRKAVIFETNPSLNLALLWVVKPYFVERFPFVELFANCSCIEGESVFSYVHQGKIPFSLFFAEISHPLPPLTQDDIADTSKFVDLKSNLRFRYRTLGFLNPNLENQPDLQRMNISLPLIEIHGFRVVNGCEGSPTFKGTGEFIGLIFFTKGCRDYVIPLPFIYDWVTRLLGPFDKITRQTEGKKGQTSWWGQMGHMRPKSTDQRGKNLRGSTGIGEILHEKEQEKLDAKTKKAALRNARSFVYIISPNLPDEMTEHQGMLNFKRRINDQVVRVFGGTGLIIECEDVGDSTYVSTIFTCATLFVRSNGVQPDEIEVEVYLSSGRLYKGKIVACDFHFNLAAIKIVSDTPLHTAELRGLDDVVCIDSTVSFQLRPHSNLYKLLPMDKVIAVACRSPSDLCIACGVFSSTLEGKGLYSVAGIENEGYLGAPVVNPFGEVIGVMFCNSAFMPINIVSRWWLHYKSCREFHRPWTGLEVSNLHESPLEVLEQFTQNFHNILTGVVVIKVEQDSSAYSSGLRPSDVIVQCDGEVVQSTLEFFEKIWNKGEKTVEFNVLRASNASRLNLTVMIGETTPDRFYCWPLPIWFPRAAKPSISTAR